MFHCKSVPLDPYFLLLFSAHYLAYYLSSNEVPWGDYGSPTSVTSALCSMVWQLCVLCKTNLDWSLFSCYTMVQIQIQFAARCQPKVSFQITSFSASPFWPNTCLSPYVSLDVFIQFTSWSFYTICPEIFICPSIPFNMYSFLQCTVFSLLCINPEDSGNPATYLQWPRNRGMLEYASLFSWNKQIERG